MGCVGRTGGLRGCEPPGAGKTGPERGDKGLEAVPGEAGGLQAGLLAGPRWHRPSPQPSGPGTCSRPGGGAAAVK